MSDEGRVSVSGFDHVTVVVDDVEAGRRFFGLLGFVQVADVTVEGETMAAYMGIAGWKAEHVTLRLPVTPPQEVQLLRFEEPAPEPDPFRGSLSRFGFNHVCFRVDDLDAMIARLGDHGHTPRNDVLEFHDRRLVFFDGPGGVVVELAEWS